MKSNSNALCIFCISICKTFWTPLVYNTLMVTLHITLIHFNLGQLKSITCVLFSFPSSMSESIFVLKTSSSVWRRRRVNRLFRSARWFNSVFDICPKFSIDVRSFLYMPVDLCQIWFFPQLSINVRSVWFMSVDLIPIWYMSADFDMCPQRLPYVRRFMSTNTIFMSKVRVTMAKKYFSFLMNLEFGTSDILQT